MRARLAVGLLVLVLAVLTLYPLSMLLYGSLHTTPPGEPGEFSLAGYRALATSKTLAVLANTVGISLSKTILSMVLALGLAWIVARTDTPWRRTLEVLISLPFFIPPILTATAWGMLATPRGGLINLAWTGLTGSSEPLVNIYSYGGVVWHMMQYTTPFLFLLFATAFRSMDPSLEESSRMSGASAWGTFRRVTLSLMLPVTTSAFILAFVRGVEAFESPIFFGTPARIHVLTTEIYNSIHHDTEPDYQGATALAFFVMALLSLLIVWQWRLLGSRSFLTVTGRGYQPRLTPLGHWRFATFGLALAFVLLTVALPVGQLLLGSFFKFFGFYRADMLTLQHYREVWESRLVFRALSNTLLLGFAGATATMLLGSVAAYVVVRTRFPARRLIEALAWLPWMMPGMVLGVGLLWAYAFLPAPFAIYGTRWALLLAYVTLSLPLAVRTMAGGLARISADLEECSRVHGAGFWTTFRRILLSLSWPSFAVGWIFLFFIILRELSASILLYGPGSEVLSVVVMRLWSEGKAEEVSVVALIMLLFVFAFRLLEARIVKTHEVNSW
jgi:iron(III) transport system permease protein